MARNPRQPSPQAELRTMLRDLLVKEAGLDRPLAGRIVDRCVAALDRRYFSQSEKPAKRASEPEQRLLLPEKSFDPYAFGAVAVLMSEGREALTARLEEIKRTEDLHLLATTQHLSVDPGLSSPDDLRTAIVHAAERRIAARRRASAAN